MENIHIIVDISSSMSVLSKRSILQNVFSYINDVSNNNEYQDINFIFYTWGAKGINKYVFQDSMDIEFSSKAEINDIKKFIEANTCNPLKILLLTDGYIDTLLCTIPINLLNKTIIEIINIGIDSDTFGLAEKFSALSFNAENISHALSYICFHV